MSRPGDGRSVAQRQVFLHIGEPKTGTTYLQRMMWAGRDLLRLSGVLLPGSDQHDVFRAVQDVRDIVRRPDDPAASWVGEWDRLAGQARRTPRAAVISHELLCAATSEQVERAVSSFAGCEVHVVLTVRDMASLLPAEWQESVKHRSTRAWDDWLADVIDKEAVVDHRRDFWFWRVHDTQAILGLWARFVPPERIHVITVPREAGDPEQLWRRLAQVLAVASDAPWPAPDRRNPSLGVAEVELLRQVNAALPESIPDWFYMHHVKEPLAHGVLADRGRGARLRLPEPRQAWARDYAQELTEALGAAGYDIVGSLDDLRPAADDGSGIHPDAADPDAQLAAAVAAARFLVMREYGRAIAPRTGRRNPEEWLLGATRSSPRLRRVLYQLSDRNRYAARVRSTLRQRLERSRLAP